MRDPVKAKTAFTRWQGWEEYRAKHPTWQEFKRKSRSSPGHVTFASWYSNRISLTCLVETKISTRLATWSHKPSLSRVLGTVLTEGRRQCRRRASTLCWLSSA